MKKTLAIMINILILFSMLSSLCACSNHMNQKALIVPSAVIPYILYITILKRIQMKY